MSQPPAVLVLEDDPNVCAMLRDALAEDGYAVQTVSDANAGVQVLRDSPTPMTVLVNVVEVEQWRHARSGLGLLDALSRERDAGGEHLLGRHAYVLMSTNPERALALAGAVPPHLGILAKPFRLEALRASLEWAARGYQDAAREPAAA